MQLPDGSFLDISASTTQGLQEAVNYALAHGYDLELEGGGFANNTTNVGQIALYSTLNIPAFQQGKLDLGSATLAFASSVDIGINCDSCMGGEIRHDGQINMHRTEDSTIGVRFRPINNIFDGFPCIIDSHYRFHGVAVCAGTCVQWATATANAGIDRSQFDFIEVNGGVVGMGVQTPNASSDLRGNRINCLHLHGQTSIPLNIGDGNSSRISCNQWNVSVSGKSGCTAIRTFGQNDTFFGDINDDEGATSVSFKWEQSAARNKGFMNRMTGYVQDLSTSHDNGFA